MDTTGKSDGFSAALLAGFHRTSGSLLFESPAFGDFTGGLGNGLNAFSHMAIIHPDDVGRMAAFFAALPSLKAPTTTEYRLVGKDGGGLEVSFTAVPRGDEILASMHFRDPERHDNASSTDELWHFRELADAMPQLVWQANSSGGVQYYNRQVENYSGAEQDPVTGEWRWGQIVHPDDLEPTVAAWNRSVETGEVYEIEHRIRMSDDTYRWHLSRGVPIRDAGGHIVKWFGTATDIHSMRLASEAIRLGETRLRIAQEAANIGTWESSFTDGVPTSTYWSSEMWRIYGIEPGFAPPEEAFVNAIHPDDRDMILAHYARLLASDQDSVRYSFRIVRPDGRVRWIESIARVVRDEQRRPLVVTGVNLDTTDAKESQDELRQREAELRSLTENTPDILTRFDRDCRHVFVSRAVLTATGLPPEAFIGKTNRDLGMPTHLCDRWEAAIQATFETGHVQSESFEFETPCGLRHFETMLIPEPAPQSGRIEHVLSVARDITELKAVMDELRQAKEAAESASRARDKFLAVLSHELRTPLSPILMTSSVYAREPSLPQPVREAMDMIRRNVKVEARLIDDLLDLSRVLNGKLHLDNQPIALHHLAMHAVETCAEEIQSKRLDLQVTLAAQIDDVAGDPARLQQVLWNLLKNAIKFTDEGGTIEVMSWNEPGSIALSVRDTGCGIPADALARIFHAFEQAGDRASQSSGGLGLGLAISKGIVDLHRGSLTAHSDGEARGAEFVLRLPTALEDEPEPTAAALPENGGTIVAPRLLLVEDHYDTASAVSALLTSKGFDVMVAADGRSAMDAMRGHDFDLLVSDVGLPDIDGIELFPQLRAIRSIPGIAVSGYGTEDDLRRSREAGFADHLVKPIDSDKLEQAIWRLLTPVA